MSKERKSQGFMEKMSLLADRTFLEIGSRLTPGFWCFVGGFLIVVPFGIYVNMGEKAKSKRG